MYWGLFSKMTEEEEEEERKKERKQDLEVGFKRDEADLKMAYQPFIMVAFLYFRTTL